MSIDRKRFLMMAFSLSLGACGPKAPTTGGTMENNQTDNATTGDTGTAPADECVNWDPSGECIGWAGDTGAAPADECVNWDPSGECIGWAGDSTMPADECVDYDPSGECIQWAGDEMGD
jgi:hypothetical protein